jgi:LmbE family N-acetylglucosaminyl deacetylase
MAKTKNKNNFDFTRSFIVIILVVFIFLVSIEPYEGAASIFQMKNLPLSGYHRLLVFAPHEDDETLGQGGLIQHALAQGMDVHVVIETNGDSYIFATMEEFRKAFPSANDYIRIGDIRQQESLTALKVLGVPKENVTFLSYPDRGTPALWIQHWSTSNPYKSNFTESTRSPYIVTFNPQSNYSGEDLLKDILTIMTDFQPDLIVYPNPEDVHPDHRGLSDFVRLAVHLERLNVTGYNPTELTYLVHRPKFPIPHGYLPNTALLPPQALYDSNPNWYKFDLSADEVARKNDAVSQYKSQLPSLRGLLESFVRSNELFATLDTPTLPIISSGVLLEPTTWMKSDGTIVTPVEHDPIRDATMRAAIGAGDLVAMYAAEVPDRMLYICAETRGEIEALFTYYIQIKAYNGTQFSDYTFKFGGILGKDTRAYAKGNFVCGSVGLQTLGNPLFIMTSAEVQIESLVTLDRMAWQMIDVPH